MLTTQARNNGLDSLRSLAIILVFMFHYFAMTNIPVFGYFSYIGWIGVDLFFVLSGYLIGNQIFSALAKRTFSLKTFYIRRFLRTLPNYLFVLSLYFLIPGFSEHPLQTPLWKFLTFTQNFGLHFSGFSHAWSLCIEEQFYFLLPLLLMLLTIKKNIRFIWYAVAVAILGGLLLRGVIWYFCIQPAGVEQLRIYMTDIYYPTYSRLDGLVLGVAIAVLQNFHQSLWDRLIRGVNAWILLGIFGCWLTSHPLLNNYGFMETTFGYLLRSVSFAALVMAALSNKSFLYRIKIPGATFLATLSYAIYLTHKQVIHIILSFLTQYSIGASSYMAVIISILASIMTAWLLYSCIEKPFLIIRDKIGKMKSTRMVTGIHEEQKLSGEPI